MHIDWRDCLWFSRGQGSQIEFHKLRSMGRWHDFLGPQSFYTKGTTRTLGKCPAAFSRENSDFAYIKVVGYAWLTLWHYSAEQVGFWEHCTHDLWFLFCCWVRFLKTQLARYDCSNWPIKATQRGLWIITKAYWFFEMLVRFKRKQKSQILDWGGLALIQVEEHLNINF